MNSLTQLGFDALAPSVTDGFNLSYVMRVAAEYGDRFEVVAEPSNRLIVSLAGALRTARPAVGDFVELDEQRLRIERVVPRRTAFVRQAAGESTRAQVIAANIDVVFVVTSMNAEFNESRLERYVAVAWESGAMPVILVNKSDLAPNAQMYLARAANVACGVDVVGLTALEHGGVSALDRYFGPGRTFVLVGSSGVGKSTIVNAIVGSELQATRGIREDDDEGRHTTTRRDLVVLSDERGVLIDTPGMRELKLWGAEEGIAQTFSDIEELGQQCRFRDCSHNNEPGCAITEAVESGELKARRLRNYEKLQRELAYHDRKRSAADARAESRRWAKTIRDATKTKR